MREYVYRKHLRKPGKYLILIICLILSIILELGLIYYFRANDKDKAFIAGLFLGILVMILIIIGIEFLVLYFLMFRKFKKVKVCLTDDGITYDNLKGNEFIAYESIEVIKFPSIRYVGGWVKIKSNNKTIRLTVVLEKIGDFMEELKKQLDIRGMDKVYSEKKVYNFCKTATYSDQSWERIYEKFKIMVFVYILSMLIAFGYSVFINPYSPLLLNILIIMLYPFAGSILAEIILGFKLSNRIKDEGYIVSNRNKDEENKIYKISYTVLGILLVAILLIMMI